MAKWFQAIRQPTTYLWIAVIVIVWGGIWLLANPEHERSYADAVRQGGNLTRVLEQYIRRVVQFLLYFSKTGPVYRASVTWGRAGEVGADFGANSPRPPPDRPCGRSENVP